MKKVRLIIRLYTEGVSKKAISEKSGCGRNTVKKYIRQFIAEWLFSRDGESLEAKRYYP